MNKNGREFTTFNTSGLCFPGKHYMVDPLKRLKEVETLIDEELYFTIHAPRQTGKTTYLHALARKLNAEGRYIALVVSFEQAGYGSITVKEAQELLIACIYDGATEQLSKKYWPETPGQKKYLNLKSYLKSWCKKQKNPIVLFIDEIDALLDDVLISVLRQFRDGYQSRPKHFPASIVLVGLRDIRDYKAIIRGKKSIEKAKHQLIRYLDRLGLNQGYLVIFDPSAKDWEKKIYMKETLYNDKTIFMVGV